MFQTIGIIGKFSDPSIGDTIAALGTVLARRNIQAILERGAFDCLAEPPALETADLDTLGRRCDLVIVVGGDGTFLHAARSLADYDIPLVGVNLGRLGFLVDISPAEMGDRLDEILDGRYREEKRALLHAYLERDGQQVEEGIALNDVVIHKWNTVRMIEFQTYVDGALVHRQRSDGTIVATPTGSTAYALSGGGPIVHPALNAILLVPVCPHTLSNRPLVIDGDSHIKLEFEPGHADCVQVTLDGQINFGLQEGDTVHIARKARPIRLLHPHDHDHYQILRAKLHWG